MLNKMLHIDIQKYIDRTYEPLIPAFAAPKRKLRFPGGGFALPCSPLAQEESAAPVSRTSSIRDAVAQIDESFSECLLRLIDEKGMTDAECYKKAHIDRKLFSKIRSNSGYRPSKSTVLSFAIALELDLDETTDLLRKAGFALSHSSKFDIIVEYFIIHEKYDIITINEALYEFDQPLLN
ncbi:MAG: hypothetical protein IJH32_03530 [Ruminococcus sp.]|nr:hypothetical protein [Ruminococcus sp.]